MANIEPFFVGGVCSFTDIFPGSIFTKAHGWHLLLNWIYIITNSWIGTVQVFMFSHAPVWNNTCRLAKLLIHLDSITKSLGFIKLRRVFRCCCRSSLLTLMISVVLHRCRFWRNYWLCPLLSWRLIFFITWSIAVQQAQFHFLYLFKSDSEKLIFKWLRNSYSCLSGDFADIRWVLLHSWEVVWLGSFGCDVVLGIVNSDWWLLLLAFRLHQEFSFFPWYLVLETKLFVFIVDVQIGVLCT